MKEQLLRTSGSDVLSSRKQTEKNLRVWLPPPPLRVRPRVKSTCSKNALEKVCTVLISSCGTPYKPRKDFRFYCLTGDKGSPNVHKQDKVHSIN